MGADLIRVRAYLQLLSTADGGRDGPVLWSPGGYRPNHNFDHPEGWMTIGVFILPEWAELQPGHGMEVEAHFLDLRDGFRQSLSPGLEWRIQEGSRLVGHGTIIEVIPGAVT